MIQTSNGQLVLTDRIEDRGEDQGRYRFHIWGVRYIKSRHTFSKSPGWKVCGSYEIVEQ